jgi:hypothetical protein
MTVGKLTSGHLHEILDRGSIFGSMVEQFLCEYPGLKDQYPELHDEAENAAEALFELYQKAGRVMFDLEDEEDRERKNNQDL